MTWLVVGLAALLLAEKAWRHALVVRFFRRPVPAAARDPKLVSILQPILSGDPTLPDCLERNLCLRTRYSVEFVWLVDDDDWEAQRLCRDLAARHPERPVAVLVLPPPSAQHNPKTVKLIAGMEAAGGDVVCVLDDDTVLPDGGLEQCLPYLDRPGVGLAFGLPYYVHFGNLWSSLVSCFVNASSLLTYVPYIALADPFTVNGMFYAARRDVLAAVGGFAGLEETLADDFAVARRFRAHGWRLAQTPLRHGIATHVRDLRHYLSLMQRWFVFPRESLLRHLKGRDRVVVYGMGLVANLAPLLLVVLAAAFPSVPAALAALLYFGYSAAVAAHLNRTFLHGVTPGRALLAVPLVQILFPVQLLAALVAPQRIVWRGHVMEAEPGGGLRVVRRRTEGGGSGQEQV
uniref:FIG036672: Nucleoside-diphosphate-sugar epimerase n=1 Tax=uncultured Armatimonadetes bacterium TaxID=157466 RepID=A0A6J4JW89_9BACT|nr:FIG036672: Nucleoside-diphosphate-sugar epimerase [uncultured Armatimonadetes bacterium]